MGGMDSYITGSCVPILGFLGLLMDTWFPWVFGYALGFPPPNNPDAPGKVTGWQIITVVVVAFWSVSAMGAIIYLCFVPMRKYRFHVMMCHLWISVIGSALITRNLLTEDNAGKVLGIFAAVLTLRLIHFLFVASYLRYLKDQQRTYVQV